MRILLLPSLERYRDEDSSLLLLKCFAEVAVKRGWGVHLAVPPETPLFNWNEMVHVHRVSYPCWTRQIAALNICQPLSQLVHTGPDSLCIDGIVTTDSLAAYLAHLYLQSELFGSAPQVYTTVASSKYMGSDELVSKGDMVAENASYALGCAMTKNYQPTKFMRSRLLDLGRAYLGPHLFERLEQNTVVSMIGPWCSRLDQVRSDAKRPKFSLYYGGRFTISKGGENVVKQYIRFVEGGRDADIIISAVGNYTRLRQMLKKEGGADVVEVFSKLPASEAWKLMSECHASMFYQSLKILPSSPYEQMYCGLVVLFKDHGYEKELLPPDYPYIFKTELEGATMLRWVYDNYENASEQIPQWREWVRVTLDRELAYNQMLEEIELEIREWRSAQLRNMSNVETTMKQMGSALYALGDGAKWEDVLISLKSLKMSVISVPHIYALRHRGLISLNIYRLFVPDGWEDTNEEVMPVLRRVNVSSE